MGFAGTLILRMEDRNRMKATLFLAHPDMSSFCHAIADHVCGALKECDVDICVVDLYKINFNPVLTMEEYVRKDSFDEQVSTITSQLESSDIIIFIHPDWWGGPPAILKGMIDRVFRQGVAYNFEGDEFEKKRKVLLFADKKTMVFCTTDSSDTQHIDYLKAVWKQGVFDFCGITDNRIIIFSDIRNSSYSDRCGCLDQAESVCKEMVSI